MKDYKSYSKPEQLMLYMLNSMRYSGMAFLNVKKDAEYTQDQITKDKQELQKLVKILIKQKNIEAIYPKTSKAELHGYKIDDNTLFILTAKGHLRAEEIFKEIYGEDGIPCGWPLSYYS